MENSTVENVSIQNSNEVVFVSLKDSSPSDVKVVERDDCGQEFPVKWEEQDAEEKGEKDITFFPPAYIQRYARVREELSRRLEKNVDSPRSVLEVGCAEFGMHFHFKNLPHVQKVIYMDIDKDMLEEKIRNVQPLPTESLIQRESPLTIEVYSGCITQADARIKNSDPPLFAIVGIEILEHLNIDVEEKFVYTIFKKYAPPIVILTTPNSDFNAVLGLEKGQFRHWDHRFELTRAEFFDWCTMVCEICPEYTFSIEGIAVGPPGSEQYGCLSQMAVFELNDKYCPRISEHATFRNSAYRVDRKSVEFRKDTVKKIFPDNHEIKGNSEIENEERTSQEPYTLLAKIDYPWRPKPPLRERVINEVQYYINYFVYSSRRIEDHEENGGGPTIFVSTSELLNPVTEKIPDASALDYREFTSWLTDEGYVIEQENGKDGVYLNIPTNDDSFDEAEQDEEYPGEIFQYSTEAGASEEESWD